MSRLEARGSRIKPDATGPRYSAPLFLVRLVARSELRFNNTPGVKYGVQLDSLAYDDDAPAQQTWRAPEWFP